MFIQSTNILQNGSYGPMTLGTQILSPTNGVEKSGNRYAANGARGSHFVRQPTCSKGSRFSNFLVLRSPWIYNVSLIFESPSCIWYTDFTNRSIYNLKTIGIVSRSSEALAAIGGTSNVTNQSQFQIISTEPANQTLGMEELRLTWQLAKVCCLNSFGPPHPIK